MTATQTSMYFRLNNQSVPKTTIDFNKFLLFKYNYYETDPKYGVNLGDYVQTIATRTALQTLFPTAKYRFFDRDNLSNYDGDGVVTIMQGWFSNSMTFLPNKKIVPVFIGTHLIGSAQKFIVEFIKYNPNYFKHQTIGCRDRATKQFFNKLNIPAYVSRCLTLTLPKRSESADQNKVFMVNVPPEYLCRIPETLTKDAIYINQRAIDTDKDVTFYLNSEHKYIPQTEALLNRYKNEAKLIITGALHCASPCTAMGIPTVFINFGTELHRLEAIKDIIPIHTVDDQINNNIDYNVAAPDIEDLKIAMLENLALSVKQAKGKRVDKQKLNELRTFIENYSSKK